MDPLAMIRISKLLIREVHPTAIKIVRAKLSTTMKSEPPGLSPGE
jgi:hypothetical protein